MRITKRYEVTYCEIFGIQHMWIVIGGTMAKHLWIRQSVHAMKDDYDGERYLGGVETHWRSPPEHARFSAPDHNNCRILGAPCWHDGTSLWASEKWIPQWECSPHDHKGILDELEYYLKKDMGALEDD